MHFAGSVTTAVRPMVPLQQVLEMFLPRNIHISQNVVERSALWLSSTHAQQHPIPVERD